MKLTLTTLWVCGSLALYSLINSPALAIEPETTMVEPKADALLLRYVEAVGGEAALHKIKSQRLTGSLERHGNKVPIIRIQKEPNLLLSETRFSQPGTLKQGFDGKTGWIQHPLQGGRRLEGMELAALSKDAWLQPVLHLHDLYPVRRWIGSRTIEGQKLTALSLASKKGAPPETWFFDDSSNLLVRVEQKVDGGPKGEIPVVILFGDFKKISEVYIPFTITTKLPTVETVLRIESIEHNIKIDESTFQAPF